MVHRDVAGAVVMLEYIISDEFAFLKVVLPCALDERMVHCTGTDSKHFCCNVGRMGYHWPALVGDGLPTFF